MLTHRRPAAFEGDFWQRWFLETTINNQLQVPGIVRPEWAARNTLPRAGKPQQNLCPPLQGTKHPTGIYRCESSHCASGTLKGNLEQGQRKERTCWKVGKVCSEH